MGLIVKYTSDYDDSADRDAWKKYCESKKWEICYGYATALIDAYMCNPATGKLAAVEIMRNACWKDTVVYPEEAIHVPRRKFPYFKKVLDGVPLGEDDHYASFCGRGWLVILNDTRDKAALINFKTIMKYENILPQRVLNTNGEACLFVMVPTKYIYEYIEIS